MMPDEPRGAIEAPRLRYYCYDAMPLTRHAMPCCITRYATSGCCRYAATAAIFATLHDDRPRFRHTLLLYGYSATCRFAG